MSQVVDQLAELTGFRDRDLLDTTLATAMRDLLRPLRVAIHRCVGDDADRRWLTRARLGLTDVAASADPPWTDFHDLPPLAAFPARLQALRLQDVVALPGAVHLAVFPLTTDREVEGVLEIESDQPLDAGAHRLVGSILRIYRNFQSLLDYSERDTLTGLLNRKTFDEAFYKLATGEAEAASLAAQAGAAGQGMAADAGAAQHDAERRHPPQPRPHYIGVIDIDHFKAVNDNFGHLIGDEVLLLLSRLMRSVFRFDDRLYRFGGEEFVVLMRCGNDTEAGLAFERLRTSVQGYAFPQVGSISVSVGYTRLRPGDTPSSSFERADRAVYWAKGHGRNRVCSHADLMASGDLVDAAKSGDVELF
jgi:diguanylate cyclase (GGDEF)-like protein